MAFILSAQRDDDATGAFTRYGEYLRSVRDAMPPSALALASSDWYFSSGNRSPHDAWLESLSISEASGGEHYGDRLCSIRLRLRTAHRDGFIRFHYPQVFKYQLDASDAGRGHHDWRYDEFRLSEDGHLVHEIEWWGGRTNRPLDHRGLGCEV